VKNGKKKKKKHVGNGKKIPKKKHIKKVTIISPRAF
jgi:hypothetical protein